MLDQRAGEAMCLLNLHSCRALAHKEQFGNFQELIYV